MRISDWSSDVCSSDLSPDRLVGHASILPEPTDICRDLRIFDHLHRDRSDGAPITKKLNEVPCATPPSLPAGSGQLAALAENRAPTIVIGILFGDRVIDRSEEHTSELQSLMRISYAVFC